MNISNNIDSFNRIRISGPKTLFESKFFYNKQEYFWDEICDGDASSKWMENESSILLSVNGIGRVVRQTREYFTYQPGKSFLIFMSGYLSKEKFITSRIGLFDDSNDKKIDSGGDGVFFQSSNDKLYVCKRSFTSGNQVDHIVEQENWNIDKLNGEGPSGYRININNPQIFFIDLEWLGVGTIRFGVIIDGKMIYCHKMHHSNLPYPAPYMRTSNLPIRYEIFGTGNTRGSIQQICCSVISEGGYDPKGSSYSASRGISPLNVGANLTPLITIRPSILNNRVTIIPSAIAITSINNDYLRWSLIHNGSLSGKDIMWVISNKNSYCEYNMNASQISGGEEILSGYISGNNQITIPVIQTLKGRSNINGEPELITLAAQNLMGTTDLLAAISWQELY